METIAYFGIVLSRAKELLTDVERAVSQWRKIGTALGMATHELDAVQNAFEHPQRAVARREIATR